MALSSPGIGSGLDVQGIVQKLVAVERQPLAKVNARVGELKAQISAYGTLKSAVSTFRDAVGALAEPTKFKVNAAQSSDTKVLTASASSEAVRGTHRLEVKRLAEAHRLATEQAQASATEAAVGLGTTLTLSVGGTSFQVDIAGKSLNEIRDAINGATGIPGVTASVFRADDGFRLMLQSEKTGSAGFIEVKNGGFRTLNRDRDGRGGSAANPGGSFAPQLSTGHTVDGLSAGALTINGVGIGAVAAGTNDGQIAEGLVSRINEKTAEHGVTAALSGLVSGRRSIELSHASGGAIALTTDPGLDPGILTFFATASPFGVSVPYNSGNLLHGPFFQHPSDWLESQKVGEELSFSFVGDRVQWWGHKFPYGGTGHIYIDGVYQETVDFYHPDGSQSAERLIFERTGLPYGRHEIKLVVAEGWNYMKRIEFGGSGAGAQVATRALGLPWTPGDEPPEVKNGIAAGALTLNGTSIDAVGAGANTDEILDELLARINEKTAMHGVTAAAITLADGRRRIELSHAGGGAIEVKSDPLVDGGISTFFANGTSTTPPGGQPDVATFTGIEMPSAQAVLVPSAPPLGHPTGVLAAGSLRINGYSIGEADFTADQTVGGMMTALSNAINAKTAEHHVDASIDKNGDKWTLRLTSILGKAFDFTVYPELDEWTAGVFYPAFVPNGYTQTVNVVTPPTPTPTPTPAPTPAFTAADLDAEIELEGRFTVTRSSNTLSDVIEHVTLNLAGVGETVVNVDRDLATVQASAQAIAKSYSDLVATFGRLGGEALRGERSTLGGIERELRAVLSGRVDVDSAFANAFETGFSTQKNGSLSLDTTTFGKALAQDFDGLARLFADPERGIAKRLYELADSWLETGALLDGRTSGLSRQVREAESRRSAMEQRLKVVEERLLKQYNSLDLLVNRLQGTNSALGSQLEAIAGFYRQNRR